MAKNTVNDNGLSNSVPEAIITWYRCQHEIKKLKEQQERCSKNIQLELDNARKHGYSDEEIKLFIGTITIPSWYLIDDNEL